MLQPVVYVQGHSQRPESPPVAPTLGFRNRRWHDTNHPPAKKRSNCLQPSRREPEDAMSARSASDHAFAFARIFPRLGLVCRTDDVITALDAQPER